MSCNTLAYLPIYTMLNHFLKIWSNQFCKLYRAPIALFARTNLLYGLISHGYLLVRSK
jgi:hypothetical protein